MQLPVPSMLESTVMVLARSAPTRGETVGVNVAALVAAGVTVEVMVADASAVPVRVAVAEGDTVLVTLGTAEAV
jgi:hypothetical protein